MCTITEHATVSFPGQKMRRVGDWEQGQYDNCTSTEHVAVFLPVSVEGIWSWHAVSHHRVEEGLALTRVEPIYLRVRL